MNKLLRYQGGTWIVGPGPAEQKTKSKTASQTVQKPINPATINRLSPSKSEVEQVSQGLSNPWLTCTLAGLLGVSLAFNIFFYIQDKHAQTQSSIKSDITLLSE